MSLQSNYQNVAFATEYAVDKIVGIYTDSFDAATQTTVLGGYLYQYAFSHSFTRPVFCELLWSLDGSQYADGGSGVLGGTEGIAYSDKNNIYVTTGINAGRVYYKVIASWIDNYDNTNPLITPVINTTNNFYFDSRKNYEKVYKQDILTLSGVSGTLSYIHGLGYPPNAKVYYEAFPGQIWPSIGGGENFFLYDPVNQYVCETTMTSSTLNINLQGGVGSVSSRAWYRVYLDR